MKRWLKDAPGGRSRAARAQKPWPRDEWLYSAWAGKGDCWKGLKTLSESRCDVKTEVRKKAETDKWMERNDECLNFPFFRLFPPTQSQASPAGRRLLLHPVCATCFPSRYPPTAPPSILYGCSVTPPTLGFVCHGCVLAEP